MINSLPPNYFWKACIATQINKYVGIYKIVERNKYIMFITDSLFLNNIMNNIQIKYMIAKQSLLKNSSGFSSQTNKNKLITLLKEKKISKLH